MLIMAIVALIIAMPVINAKAYKRGRVDMYSQVRSTLGVTRERPIWVGNSLIMWNGIFTPHAVQDEQKPEQPADVCTACHVGV
jgi:hypothetical protein